MRSSPGLGNRPNEKVCGWACYQSTRARWHLLPGNQRPTSRGSGALGASVASQSLLETCRGRDPRSSCCAVQSRPGCPRLRPPGSQACLSLSFLPCKTRYSSTRITEQLQGLNDSTRLLYTGLRTWPTRAHMVLALFYYLWLI